MNNVCLECCTGSCCPSTSTQDRQTYNRKYRRASVFLSMSGSLCECGKFLCWVLSYFNFPFTGSQTFKKDHIKMHKNSSSELLVVITKDWIDCSRTRISQGNLVLFTCEQTVREDLVPSSTATPHNRFISGWFGWGVFRMS